MLTHRRIGNLAGTECGSTNPRTVLSTRNTVESRKPRRLHVHADQTGPPDRTNRSRGNLHPTTTEPPCAGLERVAMTNRILIVVDGRRVRVTAGSTLLQAAARVSRELSTLCACRIPCLETCPGLCVVEVEGDFGLKRACAQLIDSPLSCQTYTRRIRRERRRVLSTLLSRHQHKCSTCSKRRACALRSLARSYDVLVQTKRQSEEGMRCATWKSRSRKSAWTR